MDELGVENLVAGVVFVYIYSKWSCCCQMVVDGEGGG